MKKVFTLSNVRRRRTAAPSQKASSDPNYLEALTPNYLLLLRTKPSLSPSLFDRVDIYTHRRQRQVQYVSHLFWKRWIKEYLPQHQERQRWATCSRNFAEGDLVLLVDNCAPRNSWIMGKIIQTVPDKKGLVWGVRIKTKTNVLDRPITKIHLPVESELADGEDWAPSRGHVPATSDSVSICLHLSLSFPAAKKRYRQRTLYPFLMLIGKQCTFSVPK